MNLHKGRLALFHGIHDCLMSTQLRHDMLYMFFLVSCRANVIQECSYFTLAIPPQLQLIQSQWCQMVPPQATLESGPAARLLLQIVVWYIRQYCQSLLRLLLRKQNKHCQAVDLGVQSLLMLKPHCWIVRPCLKSILVDIQSAYTLCIPAGQHLFPTMIIQPTMFHHDNIPQQIPMILSCLMLSSDLCLQ